MTGVREKLEANRQELIRLYVEEGKSTIELGRTMGCSNASVYVFLRDECGVTMRKQPRVVDDILERVRELHEEGVTAYAMVEREGWSHGSVQRALKKLGIDVSHRQRKRADPLKNHEAEILALYASGEGTHLIAKRFSCRDSAIIRFLKKRGVELRPLRRYPVNEEFFDRIDTREKAYVLGFWYADGCNVTKSGGIEISLVDEDIVRSIASVMEFGGPISEVPLRGKAKLIQHRIRIGSRRMSDALTRLGCVEGKTYSCVFPTADQVPEEFVADFVRGLSDGDGTITSRASGKKRLWHHRIVGTEAICRGTAEVARRMTGTSSCVCPVHEGKKHTTWGFTVSGNVGLRRWLDFLYAEATILLERKRAKYLEFLASLPA